MLDQGAEVGDLSFLPGGFDSPELFAASEKAERRTLGRWGVSYSHVVITAAGRRGSARNHGIILETSENILASRGQAALAIGVEVNGVDGGIVVVPRDEQRSGLHGGHSSSTPRGTAASGR